MAEPFLGDIRMFAGNFAPRGYALCDGQLLRIQDNAALFSLLGTIYGGDGRTTFGLPDLRGRLPMGQGRGPGLSDRRQGQRLGAETVTLNTNQIPSHRHAVGGVVAPASERSPIGNQHAEPDDEAYAGPANVRMGASSNTGGGQPHENQPPTLVINYIIATQGRFPSRN